MSLLIFDDEADAREFMRVLIEQCDARVVTASGMDEALAAIGMDRFGLILSDIGMPHHDGYELIRRVRALAASEGGRTPAVAVTAFARAEDRTRALRAGYQSHLAKPVEPTELTAMIASLTQR